MSAVTDETLFSLPIGKYAGCILSIISAEDNSSIITTGSYSEPRPESITIYESIFNPFITGEVILDVPNGFLEDNNTRITSQDLLLLEIDTVVSLVTETDSEDTDGFIPGVDLKGVFFINNATKVSTSKKTTKYNIKFMSIEGLKDSTNRIAKSYNKMKRSDIVTNIYDEYIKQEAELKHVTPTLHSDFCCVLPNWSPSKCIKWLATGSIDAGEPQCTNFFFFQRFNEDGEVESIFTSFNDMAKEDPELGEEGNLEKGYIIDILNDEENPRRENHRTRRAILGGDFRIPDMNTTKYNRYGAWGGTLYFYDQTRKKYFDKKYNYKKDGGGGDDEIAGGADPFVDTSTKKFIEDDREGLPDTLGAPNSYKSFSPKHKFLFHSDEKDEGVDRKEEWLDTTLTQKALNIYAPIEIQIVGDSNRRVGKCVTFSDLQIRNLTKDTKTKTEIDKEKKSLGGKYLITDVTHKFSFSSSEDEDNQKHLTTLKMIRDGAPDGS